MSPTDWALHWRAHRGWPALLAWCGLMTVAACLLHARLTLLSYLGTVSPPAVNVVAVLSAGVMVWFLMPRTELETVSTRRWELVDVVFWWACGLLPALTLAFVGPGGVVFLRAMLAALGMTTLAWRLTRSPLASLVPAFWFVVTAAAGEISGVRYLGFFVIVGDSRTWIIPMLLAVLAWLPTRRGVLGVGRP